MGIAATTAGARSPSSLPSPPARGRGGGGGGGRAPSARPARAGGGGGGGGAGRARRMGLADVHVAAAERAAEGYTFFVVYGRTPLSVDWESIQVPEAGARKRGFGELNDLVAREVGRRIVVLGACTGSDAHAVGIDAIMNMKGCTR